MCHLPVCSVPLLLVSPQSCFLQHSQGIIIKPSPSGILLVSSLVSKGAAEKSGMLRAGDEILALNDQNIVGWRASSVVGLLKQVEPPFRFTVKLTVGGCDLTPGSRPFNSFHAPSNVAHCIVRSRSPSSLMSASQSSWSRHARFATP